MQYFVGLDWAAREHAVCVVDERGKVVAQFMVEHTAVGMAELVARLGKLGNKSKGRDRRRELVSTGREPSRDVSSRSFTLSLGWCRRSRARVAGAITAT
jgi:hypothetical protein